MTWNNKHRAYICVCFDLDLKHKAENVHEKEHRQCNRKRKTKTNRKKKQEYVKWELLMNLGHHCYPVEKMRMKVLALYSRDQSLSWWNWVDL